jgi:light-regulated signal transduction histidine kinase (bacteriophytochrome)
MGQLIDDILRLSRITRAELRANQVDLGLLAQSILSELHNREPERQIKVEIQANLYTWGDERLLKVALENLLANAWKFTSKQENPTISLGAKRQDGDKVFFVRDNGVGFDMAYADKLFGAFQRLHTVDEFPGTGIGLAIVQRVIHKHGGRIWAEAEKGKGATFYFTL